MTSRIGNSERCGRCAALALAALAVSLFAGPSRAIELIFDYRYDDRGFFDDPERRELLEWAGQQYSDRLDGTLGELGDLVFRARFANPNDGEMISVEDLEVEAQTMVIFVGSRPLVEGNRIAVGGPGYSQFPCDILMRWEICVKAMKGQGDPTELRNALFEVIFRSSWRSLQFPPSAFSPWGGSLSFGSDVEWSFGDSRDVPPDRFDFLSSAIHELGHVFGIGSAESWSSLVPRQYFEGAETTEANGAPVPLHADFGHWAPGTSSWAEGVPQEAAFTPGLAPGERKLLTELDIAALRDIGWTAEENAPSMIEIEQSYVGPRIKGDVNGDGVVNDADAMRVQDYLRERAARQAFEQSSAMDTEEHDRRAFENSALASSHARVAADVFPMLDGNAIGDGVIDERDVALLLTVGRSFDADGDGMESVDENVLNESIWMNVIGRPRYQPLNRWTEECFGDIPFLEHWRYMTVNGWVTFVYCSRDGTPWSTAAGLAPEEAVDEPDTLAANAQPQQPNPSIEPAPPVANGDAATEREHFVPSGDEAFPPTTQGIAPFAPPPPRPGVENDAPRFSGQTVEAPKAGPSAIANARRSDRAVPRDSSALASTSRHAAAGAPEPEFPVFAAHEIATGSPAGIESAGSFDVDARPDAAAPYAMDRGGLGGAPESDGSIFTALRDWIVTLLQMLEKYADVVQSWFR